MLLTYVLWEGRGADGYFAGLNVFMASAEKLLLFELTQPVGCVVSNRHLQYLVKTLKRQK